MNKLSDRILEGLYTELRRCRNRCNGKPFVAHKRSGDHDCEAAGCQPHQCGTLDATARYERIDSDPAHVAIKLRC